MVDDVPVPPDTRALCALTRIDYETALRADLDAAEGRTAEQWARAVLEGATDEMRQGLARGWAALGMRLGPVGAEGHVLGWPARQHSPDLTFLAAESARGLRAELFVQRRRDALWLGSFVQLETEEARALWAGVQDRHPQVMRRLLERAVS